MEHAHACSRVWPQSVGSLPPFLNRRKFQWTRETDPHKFVVRWLKSLATSRRRFRVLRIPILRRVLIEKIRSSTSTMQRQERTIADAPRHRENYRQRRFSLEKVDNPDLMVCVLPAVFTIALCVTLNDDIRQTELREPAHLLHFPRHARSIHRT